jgi:hypothetical protein
MKKVFAVFILIALVLIQQGCGKKSSPLAPQAGITVSFTATASCTATQQQPAATATATRTFSPTCTWTMRNTFSPTQTGTYTSTPTQTDVVSQTMTLTPCDTLSPTDTWTVTVTATVSETETVTPTFTSTPDLTGLVISQVYGGGGNSGATYTNDFIELHNTTLAEMDISGASVQYASATGSSWQAVQLSGTIGPGAYYLIKGGSGTNTMAALPAPDLIPASLPNLASTAGKVALVYGSAVMPSSTCPDALRVIDLVGYGPAANCYEGSGPTAATGSTTAAVRNSQGCADTNSNSADFTVMAPAPRNSATTALICP